MGAPQSAKKDTDPPGRDTCRIGICDTRPPENTTSFSTSLPPYTTAAGNGSGTSASSAPAPADDGGGGGGGGLSSALWAIFGAFGGRLAADDAAARGAPCPASGSRLPRAAGFLESKEGIRTGGAAADPSARVGVGARGQNSGWPASAADLGAAAPSSRGAV